MLLSTHTLTGLVLALAGLAGPGRAQDPVADALRGFAEVRGQDEDARAAALAQLGMFEGEEVTRVLLEELDRAQTHDYRILVVENLGRKIRPGVLQRLEDQLVEGGANREVQRACAEAIARQGNQGIDRLAEIAQEPPGGTAAPGRNIRLACLHGLSRVDEDRAWRVIAEQVLHGGVGERLEVLAMINDVDNTSVRRAREACLGDENPRIASAALRQLVEHGYGRSASSVMSLVERFGEYPSDAVRATMVHIMARALTRDLYEPLLLQAAWDGSQVRQAIVEVAPEVARDEVFVAWLVQNGLERPVAEERDAAARLLAAVGPSELSALLQPLLRRLRRAREDQVTLIVTLHALLIDDPEWRQLLLALAGSSRPGMRTVGLGLLADAKDPDGLSIAQESLSNREWTVRSAAYEYCEVVRDPSSIPLLIQRLGRESYRLKEELLDALEALTGERFQYSEGWENWWRENEDGFQLPPLPEKRERRPPPGSGSTVSYYQIPLVSNRVVFVLDISGSMNERMGTGRGHTRLREAKQQLQRVIDSMPADHWFNIIYYWGETRGRGGQEARDSVFDKMQRASAKAKESAVGIVGGLQVRGGTDIYGALELAFEDPDVDTIYLLTDGEPTHGKIVDPVELAEEVIRWNYTRRIRIHGISVGTDSELVKRLAESSGGEYVFVR